jgi:hypothetical protein
MSGAIPPLPQYAFMGQLYLYLYLHSSCFQPLSSRPVKSDLDVHSGRTVDVYVYVCVCTYIYIYNMSIMGHTFSLLLNLVVKIEVVS